MNRPGAFVLPAAVYDAYADRGEGKPQQGTQVRFTGRSAQPRSVFANLFRLYLHTAAYNLLARMRRHVASPPPEPEQELPAEALSGRRRRHGTTSVASTIPWARASLAPGAHA